MQKMDVLLPFSFPQVAGYQYSSSLHPIIHTLEIPKGELLYMEECFSNAECDTLMKFFLANDHILDGQTTDWRQFERQKLAEIRFSHIQWEHKQITLFGKKIYEPRYTAWYGEEGKTYTYSGTTLRPLPWNKQLLSLKKRVEAIAQTTFNSVLLNWYRDGHDYMGWHQDNEKELGQNPIIASLNFGASRRFLFRRKDNKKEKVECLLKDGSLLIMKGEIQHHWQHSLPKQRKVQQHRINLTFRRIKV